MMSLSEKLEATVAPDLKIRLGQLTLARNADGAFIAHHKMDCPVSGGLRDLKSNADLEETVKMTDSGEYRPLRSAPTLPCGWVISRPDAGAFLQALDVIYPAAFATWISYHAEESTPIPLRETLERQSGMNEDAGNITDQQANKIMRDVCAAGCLKKISWPIDDQCAFSRIAPIRNRIPFICLEACTFAIEAAREHSSGE